MAGTLITITDAGRAALVASGNAGTNRHEIVKVGLCNAAFAADKGLTKLPGELKRITTFAGENVARDTIHITLKDDTPDQYPLYGFGLYLENDVLFAVYSQPEPIMEKSPQAMVLLSTDIQFTTIDAAQLVFGDASFTNPPATAERQGVVELATQDETDAGADDTRAITPKTAAKRYAALTGALFAGPVIVSNGAPFALRGAAGAQRQMMFQTGTVTRWNVMADSLAESGGNAGSDFYIQAFADNGAWAFNPFVIKRSNGRVLINNGLDALGTITLNRSNGEGQMLLGQNDGYFYGNNRQVGWYSPTLGQFQFDFASRNLFVGNSPVWHAGNLNPLDKGTGGEMKADLYFAEGKRLFLDEGSAARPSLTFVNDGAPDTGLYHIGDGSFGVTCNTTTTVRFTPTGTVFDKPASGPTPAAGDSSALYATTAWVTSAIASASIGQIVMEPRTSARAGFLKANGVLLNRADYPALWAYAQASGAVVSEATWSGGNWGCFSSGDGASTFRIPELRGEHLRCWDDGRGIDGARAIGSWQDSQNRSHAHGASSAAVGDHTHSAWTDAQGFHGHHGVTTYAGDHQHSFSQPVPASINDTDRGGQSSGFSIDDAVWPTIGWAGSHAHQFDADGAGNHGHNVGIGAAGAHAHTITVNADGGTESRPRNVALLAMIRAY
ncbi:phage tail protein [Paraburkholderia phenazinium]|uniref:phage tail protein n=1 Tax=Paraburkholderia phenazinium TaxID=60549 RepID=UPI00158E79DA|nr:phage tail protein [Paraburkholderia phenazinium]